jgi:hypothetical protein
MAAADELVDRREAHVHRLGHHRHAEPGVGDGEDSAIPLEDCLVGVSALLPCSLCCLGDSLESACYSPSTPVWPAAAGTGPERPLGDGRSGRLGHAGRFTDLLEARAGANGRDNRLGPPVERRSLGTPGLSRALCKRRKVAQGLGLG